MDPDTTPYLDIANQTGRSIEIPSSERKVSATSSLWLVLLICCQNSEGGLLAWFLILECYRGLETVFHLRLIHRECSQQ